MTERVLGPTGSPRRRRSLFASALVGLAVMLAVGVASSSATGPNCSYTQTLTGSNFEIDTNANLKQDGTAGCIDWQTVDNISIPDAPSGSGDDSFGQGTAEDNPNPTIVSGSIPPNKSDLSRFGLFQETNSTGKFLHLYWSRVQDPNGTTNMDFELNKLACDGTDTNCANNATNGSKDPLYVTPKRSEGDKLITYDLSKGGTVPTISIHEWDGSEWSPAVDISASNDARGSVNTSAIPQGESEIGALSSYTFGEATIDFDALFGENECGTFGSVYLKSRSSDSFTSEIKDFVAPEDVFISNCASISTSATASVTIGNSISDTATLEDVGAGAGGTITFSLWGPSETANCSGTPIFTDEVDVNGPDDYTSASYTPSAVGKYWWIASYSGDTSNSSATGACGDTGESSVVNKAQLTVATEVHNSAHENKLNSSVPLGSVVHDYATVSGGVTGVAPTGAITFTFYTQADCGGTGTSVAVANPSTDPAGSGVRSVATSALAAGSYSYKAAIAADSNYLGDDSDCENFTVSKAQLTVSTQVHLGTGHTDVQNTALAIGSVTHDQASLTGTVTGFTPGNAITFTFYTQTNCGGTGTSVANTGADTAGGVRSADSAALSAGAYSYKAAIAADSNYLGDDSDCENFTVNQAQPSLSTAPSVIPNDSATISGLYAGATPGGTLTFKLFTNAACTAGTEVYTESKNVTGNGSYATANRGGTGTSAGTPSTGYTVSADATVRWTVVYSGDTNNATATSGCSAEPVVIDITP